MANGTDRFTISVMQDAVRTLCVLGGRMTHASYEQFRPVLDMADMADGGPVVLDLERLSFLDSSGLGMLLILSDTVRRRGRPLHLVNSPPRLQRLLVQTNTHRLLGQ